MKKFLLLVLISAILFAAHSCKKSNATGNSGNNNSDTIPKVTAKGTPTGPIVSKFIPAGGGSITSADGRVELDFPSGALTNGEGKFTVGPLPPGDYQMLVERVGFFAPINGTGRNSGVTLAAGDRKDGLKLTLTPVGSMTGRVLNADGEPVAGAIVSQPVPLS